MTDADELHERARRRTAPHRRSRGLAWLVAAAERGGAGWSSFAVLLGLAVPPAYFVVLWMALRQAGVEAIEPLPFATLTALVCLGTLFAWLVRRPRQHRSASFVYGGLVFASLYGGMFAGPCFVGGLLVAVLALIEDLSMLALVPLALGPMASLTVYVVTATVSRDRARELRPPVGGRLPFVLGFVSPLVLALLGSLYLRAGRNACAEAILAGHSEVAERRLRRWGPLAFAMDWEPLVEAHRTSYVNGVRIDRERSAFIEQSYRRLMGRSIEWARMEDW